MDMETVVGLCIACFLFGAWLSFPKPTNKVWSNRLDH